MRRIGWAKKFVTEKWSEKDEITTLILISKKENEPHKKSVQSLSSTFRLVQSGLQFQRMFPAGMKTKQEIVENDSYIFLYANANQEIKESEKEISRVVQSIQTQNIQKEFRKTNSLKDQPQIEENYLGKQIQQFQKRNSNQVLSIQTNQEEQCQLKFNKMQIKEQIPQLLETNSVQQSSPNLFTQTQNENLEFDPLDPYDSPTYRLLSGIDFFKTTFQRSGSKLSTEDACACINESNLIQQVDFQRKHY